MNELTIIPKDDAVVLTRRSSDVAGLCKEIVLKTSLAIQGRKYVRVEGWQSIATAHGCVAGCRDVERIQGGFRAIGELRRMSDSSIIATAEGFVGEDEPTWFGGQTSNGKTLPKRPDYAIRAMCQTRAISRVCRSAFAHVVVLMDAGLSTTPAEEVPDGGFEVLPPTHKTAPQTAPARPPVEEGSFEHIVDGEAPAATVAPKTALPANNSDSPEVIGNIEIIAYKNGIKNGKPWNKVSVQVNGQWYASFSDTIAAGAEEAKRENKSVRIIYKEVQSGQYTNRNIEFLTKLA